MKTILPVCRSSLVCGPSVRYKHRISSNRKNYLRLKLFPNPEVQESECVVEYPKIKPKFPEGFWGKMNREHAWMWVSLKDNMLNLPSAQERMDVFTKHDCDAIVLDTVNDHPLCLKFRDYATKTVRIPWSEEFYQNVDTDNVDEMVNELKRSLTDHFLLEFESVHRNTGKLSGLRINRCRRILRCISDTFLTHQASNVNFKHLQTSQFDEDVVTQAVWDVHGVGREENEEEVKYSNTEEIMAIINKNDERTHSEVVFDAVLRNHFPLPQVQTLDESSHAKSEKLEYKLNSFGHGHTFKPDEMKICAGHKAGDPCEFGLVGFLNTQSTHRIETELSAKVAEDCRLAMGVTGAFTWLAAQAYNQGFNPAIDLSYPLTSQVVLSDGEKFSFLLYQLNTLALWQPANPRDNICWHTQEMPLYHSIEEGKVQELNEDVLKHLAQMFLKAPEVRDYDMKATLTEKDPLIHTKTDFIPEKVEVVEIIEEEKFIV